MNNKNKTHEDSENVRKLKVIKENVELSDDEKLEAMKELLTNIELDLFVADKEKKEAGKKSLAGRIGRGVLSAGLIADAAVLFSSLGLYDFQEGNPAVVAVGGVLALLCSALYALPPYSNKINKYLDKRALCKLLESDQKDVKKAINELKEQIQSCGVALSNDEKFLM